MSTIDTSLDSVLLRAIGRAGAPEPAPAGESDPLSLALMRAVDRQGGGSPYDDERIDVRTGAEPPPSSAGVFMAAAPATMQALNQRVGLPADAPFRGSPATRYPDPNQMPRGFFGELGAAAVRSAADIPSQAAKAVTGFLIGPENARNIAQEIPGHGIAQQFPPTRNDLAGGIANALGGAPAMVSQGIPGAAMTGANVGADRTGNTLGMLGGGAVGAAAAAVPLGASKLPIPYAGQIAAGAVSGGATNLAAAHANEQLMQALGALPENVDSRQAFLIGAMYGAGATALHAPGMPERPKPLPSPEVNAAALGAMRPQQAQQTAQSPGTRFSTAADGAPEALPTDWHARHEPLADTIPDVPNEAPPVRPQTERAAIPDTYKPEGGAASQTVQARTGALPVEPGVDPTSRGPVVARPFGVRPYAQEAPPPVERPTIPLQGEFEPTPNADRGPWQIPESERLRLQGEDVPRLTEGPIRGDDISSDQAAPIAPESGLPPSGTLKTPTTSRGTGGVIAKGREPSIVRKSPKTMSATALRKELADSPYDIEGADTMDRPTLIRAVQAVREMPEKVTPALSPIPEQTPATPKVASATPDVAASRPDLIPPKENPNGVQEQQAAQRGHVQGAEVGQGQEPARARVQPGPGHEVGQEVLQKGLLKSEQPTRPRARPEEAGLFDRVKEAFTRETEEGQKLGAASPMLNITPDLLDTWGIKLSGLVGRLRGHSLPRLMKADRAAGEAGVEAASASMASRAQAQAIASRVLGEDFRNRDFREKLGAVLTEDQLRATKAARLAENDQKAASAVGTLIGKYFPDDAAYKAALNDPKIKAAIDADRMLGEPIREGMYRSAAEIDPNLPLTLKGPDTGLHISLMRAIDPKTGEPVKPTSASGAMKKLSPFARKRTGAGEYDIDYLNMLENSMVRNAPIGKLKDFYKTLQKSGNAVEATWADKPDTIKGEKPVPMKVENGRLVRVIDDEGSKSYSDPPKYLWIRESVADEVSTAAGDGGKFSAPALAKHIGDKITGAQLAIGVGDQMNHLVNLTRVLFRADAIGPNKMMAIAGQLGGAPKLVAALGSVYQKARDFTRGDPATLDRWAEISKIGAGRHMASETPEATSAFGAAIDTYQRVMSKPIEVFDRASRLALDEAYTRLVDAGLSPDTSQGRREFINQAGQYNLKLQGEIVRWARQTGIGPFATAGVTMNRLAMKNLLPTPSAMAKNAPAFGALVAARIGAVAGTVAQVALLGYLLNGGKPNRSGIPPGAIDLGSNDENGKPKYYDPLDTLLGVRRGLRSLGLNSAVTSGKPDGDRAATEAINAWLHPFAGPGVQAGLATANLEPSLKSVSGGLRRAGPVAPPDQSQLAQNLRTAAGTAGSQIYEPATEPGSEFDSAGGTLMRIAKNQVRPFLPKSGQSPRMAKDGEKIIHGAELNDFIDDLASRARKVPKDKRVAYINSQLEKMPPEDQARSRRVLYLKKRVMAD